MSKGLEMVLVVIANFDLQPGMCRLPARTIFLLSDAAVMNRIGSWNRVMNSDCWAGGCGGTTMRAQDGCIPPLMGALTDVFSAWQTGSAVACSLQLSLPAVGLVALVSQLMRPCAS